MRGARKWAAAALVLALGANACQSSGGNEQPSTGPDGLERSGRDDLERSGNGDPSASRAARSWFEASCDAPVAWLERTARGLWPRRGPSLSFIPHRGNPFGNFQFSTTHSGPWPFLQRIPLLFYGPGFIRARGPIRLRREVTLADVVPTLAELLHTSVPRTSVGRPIKEALVPAPERDRAPRLIVTVVWDGGGRNVLERWQGAWPRLHALSEAGTWISNATVGSSPSVTPAAHATLGTGAFPKRHGIINILQRDGDAMVGSFAGINPHRLEAQTLADVYDQATDNRALVGLVAKDAMHLGMIGHGAYAPGGDRDIAALTSVEESEDLLATNSAWYSLPPYLVSVPGLGEAAETVDRDDGKLDGKWMGHPLPEDFMEERGFNKAPVWTLYQTKVIKRLLATEGFGNDDVADLFYTNYKDLDYIGHAYNFFSVEERQTIRYADDALGDLTNFLDARVGAKRWVLVMTADHGQSPLPQAVGDWPIDVAALSAAISDFVGMPESRLIDHIKPDGVWFDGEALRASNVTRRDISNFLLSYTIADNAGDRSVPEQYSARLEEPLFDAAFPNSHIDEILGCARRKRR